MKKLKLVLLMLLCVIMANASEDLKQFDKIVLQLTDGTRYEIPINSSSYIYSCIEESDTIVRQVVIVKGDNCEYKFERAEIASIRCVEVPEGMGVTPIKTDKLRYEDGVIKTHSSLAGEYITIYDLAGRVVLYTKIQEKTAVSIEHLPVGIYIAKSGGQTIKVAVR